MAITEIAEAMTNDERRALQRAQDALSTLTPTTPRDDAIAFDLRHASRVMSAAAMGASNEGALNSLRADALNALSAVTVSLDRRTLTQDMIETARQAVALVLDQLPA
jgi:hypothetical protein